MVEWSHWASFQLIYKIAVVVDERRKNKTTWKKECSQNLRVLDCITIRAHIMKTQELSEEPIVLKV